MLHSCFTCASWFPCIVRIFLLVLRNASMTEQQEFGKSYQKFTLFGQNSFQIHLGKVGFGELPKVGTSWSKASSNLSYADYVQKSCRRASFDYSVVLRIHENRVILCPEKLLIQNYKLSRQLLEKELATWMSAPTGSSKQLQDRSQIDIEMVSCLHRTRQAALLMILGSSCICLCPLVPGRDF